MSCLRKNISIITLSLLFILILGSCASTPEVSDLSNTTSISSTDNTLILETFESLNLIRDEAISIKAPKAASKEFISGESYRLEGLDYYNNDQYDKTLKSYLSAINMFKESIKITKEKREIALEALNSAEQAILQTEKNAIKALKKGEEVEI